MEFLNLLSTGIDCTTKEIQSVMGLVGIVVWGIKVVVPIILIIVGMIDMAKAVTEKNDDKIKAAQTSLIKKAIVAVVVFLVPTLVGLIMGVIGADSYKVCMVCVNHPNTTGTETVTINGTAQTVNYDCSITTN